MSINEHGQVTTFKQCSILICVMKLSYSVYILDLRLEMLCLPLTIQRSTILT